jgi:DDE superfamily endonuclease/Group II intron, maturase-specific domain
MSIPPEKEREVKAKVKRLCGYTQIPALDLFMSVNALMRGWTHYFRYANNATNRFLYLTGVVYWLTAHYLGRKYRCSIKRLMRTRYGVDPASGKRALYTTGSDGERVYLWNKPPPWRSFLSGVVGAKDVQPLPITSWAKGHSYEQRVQVRLTILCPSESYAGSTHEQRITDATPSPLPSGSRLLQPLGFLAFTLRQVEIIMSTKKPRGRALTRSQKAANRRIARRRVRTEHVNSSVKRCRMAHDTCCPQKAGVRDLIMEVCGALHNFPVQLTPWQPMV